MRIIDADALKYKNLAEVNGRLTYILTPEEINNAPTVERPQGEWISKEEALKIMCEKCPVYNCVSGCNSYRSIEKMSSVQSQRPKGKWIKIFENPFTNGYICSVCGHKIQVTEQFLPQVTDCEVCGAEMEGGVE